MIMNFLRNIFKKAGGRTEFNIEVYIKKHLKEVNDKVPMLEDRYGKDFFSFFYRHDADEMIRRELLKVLEFSASSLDCLDNDHWPQKHPFNFPGTFYTGESDSCGTGETEAPFNVLFDANCQEYVFKQPQSYAELLCVIDAGAVEVFDSYSCNGNKYWTYSQCKNWWAGKADLIYQLNDSALKEMNRGREQLYIDYLNSDAEYDLRRYCFFLENNFYPGDGVALPDL